MVGWPHSIKVLSKGPVEDFDQKWHALCGHLETSVWQECIEIIIELKGWQWNTSW